MFPDPGKIYEINVRNVANVFGNNDNSTRDITQLVKDIFLGQSHYGYGGTISHVGGDEYELSGVTDQGGDLVLAPGGSFLLNGVDNTRFIELQNNTSPGNDGIFPITTVQGSNAIRFTNAAGVAEAFAGEYRINNGHHTGRGGAFPHLVCKGSGAGTTGKGAAMDGRDRWHSSADRQRGNNRSSSNHSWIVIQNTVNGTEFLISDAPNTVFRRPHVWVSPENGFTGGATNADPTATDELARCGNGGVNTGYFFGTDNWGSIRSQWIFIQSTDGERNFLICRGNGFVRDFFFSSIVSNPENAGALIPWNGNNAIINWPRYTGHSGAANMDYNRYNDGDFAVVTIDKDAAVTGPHPDPLYLASSMVTSAMIGQHEPTAYDRSGRQFPGDRVALWNGNVGRRGRMGILPDLFWAGEERIFGINGEGLSVSTPGKRWKKFGHFYVPWAPAYEPFQRYD